MRYRSVAMSVAALSLAHVSMADAQSVYVAPGGVYVASGNVYVAPPPTPYGAPGVGVAPSVYVQPGGYGAPISAYAATPPAYYGAPPAVYAAPPAAYGAPPAVYAAPGYGQSGYVVRERVVAPIDAYAAEIPPRPPAPVPYYGRPRW
jgi:hypothetical protein